jgi:hypothetical protein
VGEAVSLWRKDARRDSNEPEIVAALELVGARVWRISQPFDLVVGWGGRLFMLEVKTATGKLKTEQLREMDRCHADGLPVAVVRTVSDALQAIGAVR